MKKSILLKIIILLIVLIPCNIKAATGNISISCSPPQAHKGESSTCTITGNIDAPISSIEANLNLSDGLTITSFNLSNGWTGNSYSNNKIAPQASSEVNGAFTLGTIVVKLPDNATANSVSIALNEVYYQSSTNTSDKYSISSANAKIDIVEDTPVVKSTLSSLTATGGILTPTLTSDNYRYMIHLNTRETNTFSISATASKEGDSIKATNADTGEEINLNNIAFKTADGKTSMQIIITVGTGETKTEYSIDVVKPLPDNDEGPVLESLTVGDKTVTIESDKYEYVVKLADVNSYIIKPTLKDSENYKFADDTLAKIHPNEQTGEGSYPINIVPKDASAGLTSMVYYITIEKEEVKLPPSSSSKPSSKPSKNPQTGGNIALIMGIVLITSLAVSIFLYQKNLNQYN